MKARLGVILPFAVGATMLAVVSAACRIGGPAPPGQSLVVLLPDPDDGTTGRAAVTSLSASNSSGGVDLTAPRDATRVATNRAPTPPAMMDQAEVQRIFGDTLSALPPASQHFNLYFLFDSDELTAESQALFPAILEAIRGRPAPDLAIVGHTDTMGSSDTNYQLGLRRAMAVRSLLVPAGFDPSFVEVASHGEADLLVPTRDETSEPRNRRVEITVR
jgi:outer membrane protein OmpA-like peptidoglycan-associated protein